MNFSSAEEFIKTTRSKATVYKFLNVKDDPEKVNCYPSTRESFGIDLGFLGWGDLISAWKTDDVKRGLVAGMTAIWFRAKIAERFASLVADYKAINNDADESRALDELITAAGDVLVPAWKARLDLIRNQENYRQGGKPGGHDGAPTKPGI